MMNGIIVTPEQIKILLEGLCVWNCPAIDLLTEKGRKKLYAAQDLIEKLYNKSR